MDFLLTKVKFTNLENAKKINKIWNYVLNGDLNNFMKPRKEQNKAQNHIKFIQRQQRKLRN
jgi:hypothetical protein